MPPAVAHASCLSLDLGTGQTPNMVSTLLNDILLRYEHFPCRAHSQNAHSHTLRREAYARSRDPHQSGAVRRASCRSATFGIFSIGGSSSASVGGSPNSSVASAAMVVVVVLAGRARGNRLSRGRTQGGPTDSHPSPLARYADLCPR